MAETTGAGGDTFTLTHHALIDLHGAPLRDLFTAGHDSPLAAVLRRVAAQAAGEQADPAAVSSFESSM